MSLVQSQRTLSSQMLGIVDEYIAAGGTVPVNPRAVAKWAIDAGKWNRKRATVITLCTRDIARALREDYFLDDKGRTVRARHSIRVVKCVAGKNVQQTFWDHHRTMPHEFAERSFQQRRRQIVGDCKQLKLDVDSYNDRSDVTRKIQLVLNFTYDIAEDETVSRSWQRPQKG